MSLNAKNQPNQQEHPPSSASTGAVTFWRTTALAALALAAVLILLNWTVRRSRAPELVDTNKVQNAPAPNPGSSVPPTKPWGRLETERIILERPDQQFSDPSAYFKAQPPWYFGSTPADTIESLLDGAGLNKESRDWFRDRGHWSSVPDGLLVAPPPELLLRLSPEARRRIYGHLAQIPGNPFKNDPFKIATNLAASWFVDSGVSKETEHLIRSLTYQRGPMLCFSDVGLLADHVPAAEQPLVLKALSRMPAQRAFLRIEHGDALQPVTNYWNASGQIARMLPLLDSLQKSATGGRIDLTYLLPRTCSERLFTFPDPATNPYANAVDCFWTALNFFRYPPEQRFLDVPTRLRFLKDAYEIVNGEPALGDIMAFYDASNEPVHACVYIAGDLVFTKNGATVFSPWVLMSYRDMLAYYSMDEAPSMRLLRARRPASS